MLRSLYSGISGMKVNQTKMDVIGNNIANVGTTGFKAGRVRFQDMLSQSVTEAMAPMANQGGVNASQVGLGVQLAGIDTIVKQGMMQPTGRNLDVGIDGEGYFLVGKGPEIFADGSIEVNHLPGTHNMSSESVAKSNMSLMYSREGSFTLDNDGNLVTSDGYRVMGYSLTNDSTRESATSQRPNVISTGGFDFRFGPGAALNGYSIALGAVGPDTVASAQVDKTSKLIILNGDFSSANGITDEEARSSINKALSAAGIAQTVEVSGSAKIINDIYTSRIKGGADAVAPSSVAVGGFTFRFNEGSALNGYNIVLGKVNPGQTPRVSAEVDSANKRIVVNGDFTTQNALKDSDIEKAVNQASGLPSGVIVTVTGAPVNFSPSDNISGSTNAKKPTPDSITVGGLKFDFGATSQLNGFTIETKSDSSLPQDSSSIIASEGKITISFNLSDPAALTADIQNKFNSYFGLNSDLGEAAAVSQNGTIASSTSNQILSGGVDREDTAVVIYRGMQFKFKFGSDPALDVERLNTYKIILGDITPGASSSASVDTTKRTITINGDFTNPGAVDKDAIESNIQSDLSALLGTGGIVTVTGTPSAVNNALSNTIIGGEDLKSPENQSLAGFNFIFAPGTELNGYTIQVGKITEGTRTSAEIDSINKKIIINGDFTNAGTVTANALTSVISEALSGKGISQSVSVEGTAITINNVRSSTANGGTPVQSMDNNGLLNFVDATKVMSAYDGSLKTLRIPDKVRIPGTGVELRVRTFSISKEGLITGVLEDGSVTALGQIATAAFKNPAGLTKLGKNLYQQSVNSGEPTLRSGIGTSGEDNSKGYGDMLQGMLEMSNVDLAEQFTDMIVTSRSFQASGKMITTGDEILQDIINLKR